MRLIDADQIDYRGDFNSVYKEQIDKMPTIDPVRRGRWSGFGVFTRCSECEMTAGYDINAQHLTSMYCPWCGAYMENGSVV